MSEFERSNGSNDSSNDSINDSGNDSSYSYCYSEQEDSDVSSCDKSADENQEGDKQIQLELPVELLRVSETKLPPIPPTTTPLNAQNNAHPQDTITQNDHIPSPASSCNFARSASCTTEGSWTAPSYHDDSSAVTSVVSGFDVLDIGGFSMRRCNLDGYLNQEGAVFCTGCGAALVANPCPEVDRQIAIGLQQKEEKQAFEAVKYLEHKREAIDEIPLFEQSQWLCDDVASCIARYSEHYQALPQADRVLATARFLACVKNERMHGESEQIYLAFTITRNNPRAIRQVSRGERKEVWVFLDPKEAIEYWSQVEGSFPLSSIQEDFFTNQQPRSKSLMWIVAVAPGEEKTGYFRSRPIRRSCVSESGTRKNPNGEASNSKESKSAQETVAKKTKKKERAERVELFNLTTICGFDATLPLVSFEVHPDQNDDEVKHLFESLEQVCLDFMSSMHLSSRPIDAEILQAQEYSVDVPEASTNTSSNSAVEGNHEEPETLSNLSTVVKFPSKEENNFIRWAVDLFLEENGKLPSSVDDYKEMGESIVKHHEPNEQEKWASCSTDKSFRGLVEEHIGYLSGRSAPTGAVQLKQQSHNNSPTTIAAACIAQYLKPGLVVLPHAKETPSSVSSADSSVNKIAGSHAERQKADET